MAGQRNETPSLETIMAAYGDVVIGIADKHHDQVPGVVVMEITEPMGQGDEPGTCLLRVAYLAMLGAPNLSLLVSKMPPRMMADLLFCDYKHSIPVALISDEGTEWGVFDKERYRLPYGSGINGNLVISQQRARQVFMDEGRGIYVLDAHHDEPADYMPKGYLAAIVAKMSQGDYSVLPGADEAPEEAIQAFLAELRELLELLATYDPLNEALYVVIDREEKSMVLKRQELKPLNRVQPVPTHLVDVGPQ